MASEEPSTTNATPSADVASTPTTAPTTTTAPAPAAETAAVTPAAAGEAGETAAAAASTPAQAPAEATEASASSSSAAAPAPKKKATKNYSTDPALYIYTSLTAGNMHIVTATSRLETILRANRVPFKATDLATDQKARMLWGRRAGKAEDGRVRRLPALVQMGVVLGDLIEIEDWNEYGELKQHVKIYYDAFTQPAKGSIAPVPKYKQPANKEAHPPAALNFPPPAERKLTPAEEAAAKIAAVAKSAAQQAAATAQSTKNVAEEAAAKAKQLRLQALREKVHGAKKESASGEGKKEEEGSSKKGEDSPVEPPTKELSQLSIATGAAASAAGAGLQSPTTGAWKVTESSTIGDMLQTVQSPTSSSWKPSVETSLVQETFAGARIANVSPEEIKKIEAETAIKEEPEPEDEEDKKKKEEEKGKAEAKAEA